MNTDAELTLSIIGAGGHARVVADAATESGQWSHIQLYDETFGRESNSGGWTIAGTFDDLLKQPVDNAHQLIIGSGDNQRRHELQAQLQAAGWSLATVIHPTATISRGSRVDAGSVVLAGAIINHGSHIGSACIINSGAIIEHDCDLARAVHISPGAVLSGKVSVGCQSWIGAGAVLIQNTRVGSHSIVGAGATVIHDIADNSVAVGNPARIIRQREPALLRQVPGY